MARLDTLLGEAPRPGIPAVLLTRPAGENGTLKKMLEADGHVVRERPLISLVGVAVTDEMRNLAANLDGQDILIFVSKAAVKFGMALIDEYWPVLPPRLQVLAVGPGTAAALEGLGVSAASPEVASSEGLLCLPALRDAGGRKVMIARGQGGRELLADTLRAGKARVSLFETYTRRREPAQDIGEFLDASRSLVVLTSGEILHHFVALARADAVDLARVSLVVASDRIRELAADCGFRQVTTAAGASARSLYDAIRAMSKQANPYE